MREQRSQTLPGGHDLAKAIDYILKRCAAFTLFLDDGRAPACRTMPPNARCAASPLGRKSWLFCGSDARRSTSVLPQCIAWIVTARMENDVDPQAWLADVLSRIAAYPAHRLDELLPWNWTPAITAAAALSLAQVNKVHHVHTIARVAAMLGEDTRTGCATSPIEMDQGKTA